MSSNKKNQNSTSAPQDVEKDIEQQPVDIDDISIDDVSESESEAQDETLESEILKLNEQLEEEKKKYMYLYAEFDNYRKRTLRDKAEIIKNGGEQAFKGLLPIIDDFERGIDAATKSGECDKSQLEGFTLIYNKLKKYLAQNGVKEFDESDDTFDADRHEAISAIAAPSDDKKGKILDTVQKGYTINGKVLRHAKVVVGQ